MHGLLVLTFDKIESSLNGRQQLVQPYILCSLYGMPLCQGEYGVICRSSRLNQSTVGITEM